MKIAIDIGHADGTGARGNGMEEHAVCSVIAGELQPLLAKMGHDARIIDYPARSNRDDLNAAISECAGESWPVCKVILERYMVPPC